jgi:hypothetical protein
MADSDSNQHEDIGCRCVTQTPSSANEVLLSQVRSQSVNLFLGVAAGDGSTTDFPASYPPSFLILTPHIL